MIALDETGEAKTTEARPKFKLRPPSERVSLHLQAKDGTYAGPVVVGAKSKGKGKGRGKKRRLEPRKKKGKKKLAIVGIKAGAKLGKVKVNKRKGYAKAKPKKKKQLDKKRTAKAKKGVPIGAKSFGLVRAKVKSKSPPDDPDADGVPDPLDIDDNGNLVIDRYEGEAEAGAVRARGGDPTAMPAGVQTVLAEVLAVNEDGSVRARACNTNIEATSTWPGAHRLRRSASSTSWRSTS